MREKNSLAMANVASSSIRKYSIKFVGDGEKFKKVVEQI
jgi:hypothetical protein